MYRYRAFPRMRYDATDRVEVTMATNRDAKRSSKTFWTAFLAGIAAPTTFYAPVPQYNVYANVTSPDQSFGQVGAMISSAYEGTKNAPGRQAARRS